MKRRGRERTEPIIVQVINSDISYEILEKLFNNIRYNDKGCWVRGEDSTIYTRVNVNGKPKLASRLMYEIVHGEPPKHLACHKCDIPACINPDHIYDGTNKENKNDAIHRSYEVMPHKWVELKRAKQYAKKRIKEIKKKIATDSYIKSYKENIQKLKEKQQKEVDDWLESGIIK